MIGRSKMNEKLHYMTRNGMLLDVSVLPMIQYSKHLILKIKYNIHLILIR